MRPVEFLRDLCGRLAALDELGDSTVVVAKLAVDRRTADELEGLGEVRVALTLTFAGELASRPAECLEERVLHLSVRDLDRQGSTRKTVERCRGAGHGRDRIEQDFGRQAAW